MKNIIDQLEEIVTKQNKLISLIELNSFQVSGNWIPRSACMEFLNYGNTQMTALENSGLLVFSKIGKRKFILRQSLEKLLQDGICKS